jgi:hypothetical protein
LTGLALLGALGIWGWLCWRFAGVMAQTRKIGLLICL